MWLQHCSRLFKEEDGPTTVEYAILLALILVVLIYSITAVGNSTSGVWQKDSTDITNASNS